LLSYLRSEFVIARGWLSETQILDAVAVGQVTPGPLFTSATFVGYLLGGWIGAIAATVGIFLPAFLLVAVSGPLVPILRRSRGTAAFLDGVNAASVGLMAAVTIGIGMSTKDDPAAIALFIAACLALFDGRIGSVRLILIGAVLGVLRTLF
jgi:chromate transporter